MIRRDFLDFNQQSLNKCSTESLEARTRGNFGITFMHFFQIHANAKLLQLRYELSATQLDQGSISEFMLKIQTIICKKLGIMSL